MSLKIERGTVQDITELEQLYDTLNDYLDCHTNYPGWRKGIYPTRNTAVTGIKEGNLFVARIDDCIVGTVILRNQPEPEYNTADWHIALTYDEILVVYTLAVHPDYLGSGIGHKLMEFILSSAAEKNMKAVRLDVYEKNVPAIHLYKSVGFQYIDTIDLGYGEYGLNWFSLYQRLL